MSYYVRYYNNRKQFYTVFATRWASWAETANLTTSELTGIAKFFRPIAKRFGLITEFEKLGVI